MSCGNDRIWLQLESFFLLRCSAHPGYTKDKNHPLKVFFSSSGTPIFQNAHVTQHFAWHTISTELIFVTSWQKRSIRQWFFTFPQDSLLGSFKWPAPLVHLKCDLIYRNSMYMALQGHINRVNWDACAAGFPLTERVGSSPPSAWNAHKPGFYHKGAHFVNEQPLPTAGWYSQWPLPGDWIPAQQGDRALGKG